MKKMIVLIVISLFLISCYGGSYHRDHHHRHSRDHHHSRDYSVHGGHSSHSHRGHR